MPIFQIKKSKLDPIKEKFISLEKDVQNLTEANLETIFGLRFISSEFRVQNFYIDTLAFDPESRTFVIIEYKREKSFSVVDQGLTYLSLMLRNKSDFILECNEKMEGNLKRGDIDWSQSRVIFIARNFTPYQKGALGFKDLPIELWEVTLYNNDTILYNLLKPPATQESIKSIKGGKLVERLGKEIRTYRAEDHRKKGSEKIKKLFDALSEKIHELEDNISEHPKKFYIGYRVGSSHINFTGIEFYKSKLRISILIPDEKLKDPKKWTKSFPESYGWAKNLKKFSIKNKEDLPYALDLITQSYNYNKAR